MCFGSGLEWKDAGFCTHTQLMNYSRKILQLRGAVSPCGSHSRVLNGVAIIDEVESHPLGVWNSKRTNQEWRVHNIMPTYMIYLDLLSGSWYIWTLGLELNLRDTLPSHPFRLNLSLISIPSAWIQRFCSTSHPSQTFSHWIRTYNCLDHFQGETHAGFRCSAQCAAVAIMVCFPLIRAEWCCQGAVPKWKNAWTVYPTLSILALHYHGRRFETSYIVLLAACK